MPTSPIAIMRQAGAAPQNNRPQATESRRKRTNAHTVPSTLTAPLRKEIAHAVMVGRSLAQTAKEYDVDRYVAVELWVREEFARISNQLDAIRRDLRRAA